MHLGRETWMMMMMMADQGGTNNNNNNNNIVAREYRKGNWTVNETMVLIEAKEMDYERRMKRSSSGGGGGDENHHEAVMMMKGKPTELRWKWVEDYCGKRGCLRSQNQCNDKWDNLMREYKRVREFQRRGGGEGSYWEMEKNERKQKNLPSNMLRQIYERLVEVVDNKGGQTAVTSGGGSGGVGGGGESESDPIVPNLPYLMPSTTTTTLPTTILAAIPLPPPPPPPPQVPPLTTSPPPPQPEPLIQPPPLSYAQPLPTLDSDTSEYSDSPAKRRRKRGGNGGGGDDDHETVTNEVGTAISKSASIIAEAIQASEEREERRHRDLISFHERRLKIEESKTEINKKGIDGLVDAINNLANSILALASSSSHKNNS